VTDCTEPARPTGLGASCVTSAGRLTVREPLHGSPGDACPDLAAFYNDPYNAARLHNTIHFAPGDVLELWQEIVAEPGRGLLLFRDGGLVGDAAFRRMHDRSAELGLLIGPRALHGVGLGRRFTRMLLAVAFGPLDLERVYVSIRPENTPSLRLFASAGFLCDDSSAARAYADADDEVCMSLGAGAFVERHADVLPEIELSARI
jgi:hypothetical protein